MTLAAKDHIGFRGYSVGQRLAYIDRTLDRPGQVGVRTGIVAGACVDGDLVPMAEAGAPQPDGSRLVAVADLIGVSPPSAPNRHLTDRKPRHLFRSLSRIGRHRR
ncbi:hypothetical protein ACIA5G_45420 [Amycolatopsis sp. NPDC051758]|uniref:hypothetical protein n=1 Tax=Amycolatopsis sp. NPDC051758 TaxID=3363935 RepID=UPI0037A56F26